MVDDKEEDDVISSEEDLLGQAFDETEFDEQCIIGFGNEYAV